MEPASTRVGRKPTRQASQGTVVVVDDDRSVRKALSRLLRSASYNVVVFESVDQFKRTELSSEPTCIVLDLQMPQTNGLDLQVELITQDYHPPIIFLSGHGDVSSSVLAMKNGAVDFLEKPVDDAVLLGTIDRAIKDDAAARSVQARRAQIRERIARLTSREHEVLTHVIAGRMNKQIGFDLGISETTVKVHRGRVMDKACVRSVAELTRMCDEIGLAPVHMHRSGSRSSVGAIDVGTSNG
ncbi:MAG: response regulator [Gammaproteobacteria bacterium]|nr:response regulator [Gammaproteobacteria bacterium]